MSDDRPMRIAARIGIIQLSLSIGPIAASPALNDWVELISATLHCTQDKRMNPTAVEDLSFIFDKDGFFIHPEQWDLALAQRIATSEDMGEMDDLQQGLLLTLRDEFQKLGTVTALSHICHLNGLDADCLHQLFRSPRQAWRIAGLPNPGEEAKAYLA